MTDIFLPMLGFKLWISGVGGNPSDNCAKTIAQLL